MRIYPINQGVKILSAAGEKTMPKIIKDVFRILNWDNIRVKLDKFSFIKIHGDY
jgi:hypothetical protein